MWPILLFLVQGFKKISPLCHKFGEGPLLFQQGVARTLNIAKIVEKNQVMQQRGHCNYIISIFNQDAPVDGDSFVLMRLIV